MRTGTDVHVPCSNRLGVAGGWVIEESRAPAKHGSTRLASAVLLYVTIHCSILLTAFRAPLAVVSVCRSPILFPVTAQRLHCPAICIALRDVQRGQTAVQRSDSVARPRQTPKTGARQPRPPPTVSSANTARRRTAYPVADLILPVIDKASSLTSSPPTTPLPPPSLHRPRRRRRHPAAHLPRYMRPPTTAR